MFLRYWQQQSSFGENTEKDKEDKKKLMTAMLPAQLKLLTMGANLFLGPLIIKSSLMEKSTGHY